MGRVLRSVAAESGRRLHLHLDSWLGRWPPGQEVAVTTAPARNGPGWDGSILPVVGVSTPEGTVLSVPEEFVEELKWTAERSSLDELLPTLGPRVGMPGGRLFTGHFRWCEALADLPDAGDWVTPDHPALPEWLTRYGPRILAAFDGDNFCGGLGVAAHDKFGHEAAVVVEPGCRRRGLGRGLVTQSARRSYDEGAVTVGLHMDDNVASSALLDTAGFGEHGWRFLMMVPSPEQKIEQEEEFRSG